MTKREAGRRLPPGPELGRTTPPRKPGAQRRYATPEELREADLSEIPQDELTAEEQAELKRRFDEFVAALAGRKLKKKKAEEPKKKIQKWSPKQVAKPGLVTKRRT